VSLTRQSPGAVTQAWLWEARNSTRDFKAHISGGSIRSWFHSMLKTWSDTNLSTKYSHLC